MEQRAVKLMSSTVRSLCSITSTLVSTTSHAIDVIDNQRTSLSFTLSLSLSVCCLRVVILARIERDFFYIIDLYSSDTTDTAI